MFVWSPKNLYKISYNINIDINISTIIVGFMIVIGPK